MKDAGFPWPNSIELPCGATGYLDGTGYRCMNCLTIFGSMACPCDETGKKKGAIPANEITPHST